MAAGLPNLPPALDASRSLALAAIAARRVRAGDASHALSSAWGAARRAAIPALEAEVAAFGESLARPVARLLERGHEQPATLATVEALLASDRLIVDACRSVVRLDTVVLALSTRPVLFALLRALAEACPAGVSREHLLLRAFRARHADESHRARLRVEIGRLRAALGRWADIVATPDGFRLEPADGRTVALLLPQDEDPHGALLALLGDGEAWSSPALALATGTSERTVQRALEDLHRRGKVHPVGNGRTRRWVIADLPSFPTVLLLPGPLPGG